MYKLSVILLVSGLCGCSALSLAPIMDSNAQSYHQIVEDVTNSILVTNILRARDHAPTHYSDLTTINGSLQGTAGTQVVFPFGPIHPSAVNTTLQLGTVSLQTTPTFNLGTLDTDDFTRGILTPVTPDIIKYFLDAGLDPRLVFLLFFEKIKNYNVTFVDADGKNVVIKGDVLNLPDTPREFFTFLAVANYEAKERPTGHALYANAYKELRPIGVSFKINPASDYKDLGGLDFTKIQVRNVSKDGKIALYAISPTTKVAFCRYAGMPDREEGYTPDGYRVFGFADTLLPDAPWDRSQVCYKNEVLIGPEEFKSVPMILYPRSPQAILEYLGALLRFQEANPEHGPLRLTGEKDSGVVFNLTHDPQNARFSVAYRT